MNPVGKLEMLGPHFGDPPKNPALAVWSFWLLATCSDFVRASSGTATGTATFAWGLGFIGLQGSRPVFPNFRPETRGSRCWRFSYQAGRVSEGNTTPPKIPKPSTNFPLWPPLPLWPLWPLWPHRALESGPARRDQQSRRTPNNPSAHDPASAGPSNLAATSSRMGRDSGSPPTWVQGFVSDRMRGV